MSPQGRIGRASGKERCLTAAEREERLPSGNAKRFTNRVGWAVSYLHAALGARREKNPIDRLNG